MSTPSSSLSSISPSQLSVHQRWIESICRAVHAVTWSLMTATLLVTTLTVLLTVPECIQNFPRLLAASFPAIFTDMTSAPLVKIVAYTSALCWANRFMFKQTKQSYQDLHVWMVQIRIVWPGPRGTWQILSIRHLTVVWGNVRQNAIGIRILRMALFQCLALLDQRIRHAQPISSSGTLTVLTDHQTTAAVMTVISEECTSEPYPAEPTPINTGIFGTILASCQIRVVGPTGKEQVIDVRRRPYRLLWLYLVAFFFMQQRVSVGDILRDVYDYDDEEDHKKKKKLSNRFHKHCSILRKEINAALREVGLPETNPLCNELADQTSFWRLADTIQFQDLTLLQDCKTLLADVKDPRRKSVALHERTMTICEELGRIMGNLAVLKHYQETPGIQELLQEILATATQALKYLAERYQWASQQSTETEVRHQFLYKEEHSWATRALLYARFAPIVPDNYQHLSRQGELTLRKALSCCRQLRDQDRAVDLYQQYREAKEQDGDPWKPEAETQRYWQSVLSLDEAA